ncbi:MAG TPA: hypothetical protein VF530_21230 [Planctomycetota bacterium]
MIKEKLNESRQIVVTSDRWHVIHAQWSGAAGTPSFVLSIVSEHATSASALRAGRALKSSLVPGMTKRPREARDQVLVRRPDSESVKNSGRMERPRK